MSLLGCCRSVVCHCVPKIKSFVAVFKALAIVVRIGLLSLLVLVIAPCSWCSASLCCAVPRYAALRWCASEEQPRLPVGVVPFHHQSRTKATLLLLFSASRVRQIRNAKFEFQLACHKAISNQPTIIISRARYDALSPHMYLYGGSEANLGRTSPARPPPAPTELPEPSYLSSEHEPHANNEVLARTFYVACAAGDLDQVRECVEGLSATMGTCSPELEYGLEEASQNLQIKVVRFLLQDVGVRLHCRCFCRDSPQTVNGDGSSPAESATQSIFTSNSDELPDLLRAFLASGWDSNLLVQPLRVGSHIQTAALHYPRCVQDHQILGLLLSNGADPSMSRQRVEPVPRLLPDEVVPVEKGDGRILEIGINWGTPRTVDLLLSHGARLADARSLHSLVRRYAPFALGRRRMSQPESHQSAGIATPGTSYPFPSDATRLEMAQHLFSLGADVNQVKDV